MSSSDLWCLRQASSSDQNSTVCFVDVIDGFRFNFCLSFILPGMVLPRLQ